MRSFKEFIVSESKESIQKRIDNAFENFEHFFNKFNRNKNKILNKKLNISSDYQGEMTFSIDKLIHVIIFFNKFERLGLPTIKVTSNYPIYSDLHKKKIKMGKDFDGESVEAAKFANELCKMIENEIK